MKYSFTEIKFSEWNFLWEQLGQETNLNYQVWDVRSKNVIWDRDVNWKPWNSLLYFFKDWKLAILKNCWNIIALKDLLELKRPSRTNIKKDIVFIIGDWNAKAGSQKIPGVTGKFGLGVQMKQGKGQKNFVKRTHWS